MCAIRDSFERFNDDLCEVIVSYLSLVDKIIYQSISKQWKRCAFKRQKILELNDSRDEERNTLNILLKSSDDSDYNKHVENIAAFESVLKKCAFIEKLKFSHEIVVNDTLLGIIADNCPNLASIEFNFYNVGKDMLAEFGEKCGKNLRRIFINRFGSNRHLKCLLEKCVNLDELHNAKIVDFIDENSNNNDAELLLPKLTKVKQLFKSEKSGLMAMFVRRYHKALVSFGTNPNANIGHTQQNILMTQISELKNLEKLKLEFNFENGFTPQFSDHLKRIAQNCRNVTHLDLQLFDLSLELKQQSTSSLLVCQVMKTLCQFSRLRILNVDIDQSPDTVKRDQKLSAKSLESCKHLTLLSLNCPLMSDDFFADIDRYASQLTQINIVTEEELTDKAMQCLSKMKKLRIITFRRTLLKYNFAHITDAGVCDVLDHCASIESIRFTARPNVTRKSVESMIKLAAKKPKTDFRHFFGSAGRDRDTRFAAINLKSFQTRLPVNLKLVFSDDYESDIFKFKQFLKNC